MPELAALAQFRREAILAIGSYIDGLSVGREMSRRELAAYGERDFRYGWEIPIGFGDATRRLQVLVDSEFPFAPPRIALVDRPEFLTWPHVEVDGVLCLLPKGATVAAGRPVEVLRSLIAESVELIEATVTGTNAPDFASEFNTYWIWQLSPGINDCLSLVNLQNRSSRRIALWKGKTFDIIAESETEISSWLTNRFGRDHEVLSQSAALIWISRLPQPKDYPSRASDILQLIVPLPPVVAEILKNEPRSITILIASTTANGVALAGMTISAPTHKNVLGRSPSLLTKGFRTGHVPASVLFNPILQP